MSEAQGGGQGVPVRLCVAGYGHWGKNLARNFAQQGHLKAICESDEGRRLAARSMHDGAAVYSRWEDVLADASIEAVALAVPAEAHYPMTMEALAAGKDVFVEKPLALEWEDGRRMVERARERDRILMVGHLLRYHPAVIRLAELLREGVLGNIEYIYSNRLSLGKIRREENALWSFAPHDISVILSLVGQMPLQVVATGGAYLQPNIADVTVSQLLFDRGVRSHIFVSWLHPYKEQRLLVIGSKQMAVFEDSKPDNKLVLYDKRIQIKNGNWEAAKSECVPVAIDTGEPLALECAHFASCVTTRQVPRTPGEEGVQVLQVLQACQRSLQMNGDPVQVSSLTAGGVRSL